ncbi:class A beta-lactamase-related serine hydrolase [Fibrisoma montanum]|uniref:Class A beta-lactamase-related serine hydrolase n=1 Tax=Fibrisoma montanum TaxID=2305895 RepID=A0A418M064_9BACT|nr:serine hydrolase domain-containing protein [Fibrisoma montanum]RIV18984.1 class A beta-lactamase-related serine hydrolase [Fibrisoma montanum]
MKSFLALGGLLAFTLACEPLDQNVATAICQEATPLNASYSKAQPIQQLLDRYTRAGIPGVAVAVYTPQEGYWAGASGYANLETKTPMQVCHLQYGQSVAKTYTAVAILKLAEAGKIDLNAPISRYLSPGIRAKITDADKITVRMLLTHTSGIADYTDNAEFVASLLQNPLKSYTSEELLAYVAKQPLLFPSGSYSRYANTNYLLLALIADQVQGDHARLIQQSILEPLGLQQTFYHNSATYLNQPTLVDSYFDRFGNGKLENITQMQRVNVGSMNGDDGIIASPTDYVKFLRGLNEGQLVSAQSLKEMTTWVNDRDGQPAYGMGLEYARLSGHVGYGHGGAGIGAGCGLYYFPARQLYVFIGINLGVLTGGPYVEKAGNLSDELIDLLLK